MRSRIRGLSACNLKDVQVHKKAVFLLLSPTIPVKCFLFFYSSIYLNCTKEGKKRIVDIQKQATFSFSKSSNTKWITFDV